MNEKFINPYEKEYQSFGGADKNLCRAPASIDMEDYMFIRGIRPTNGTINVTQCILWSKLVKILKENGITDITKTNEFESLVANLVFVDGRSGTTTSRDARKTTVGNDGGGVENARAGDTNASVVKSNPPRGNGKKKTTGKG